MTTTTNKDQLEWLKGMRDGGKLVQVETADVNLDGIIESLSGEDALAALLAMGEDELGATMKPIAREREVQDRPTPGVPRPPEGVPGADPTLASADSSHSSDSPSESQSENPDRTEQPSIPSDAAPSGSSSEISGKPETEPATDAEAEVRPPRTGERPIEGS